MFVVVGCDLSGNKPITKGSGSRNPFASSSGTTTTTTTTSTTTSTALKTVTVSWDPNKEAAVNMTGGGYRVYYSTTNPVPSNATYVTVSYASGSYAPATADIAGLAAGTYYVKVVAFSTLNTAGNTSTQVSVVVP